MRVARTAVLVSLLTVLGGSLPLTAEPPSAPVSPRTPTGVSRGFRSIQIGPTDCLTLARKMRDRMTLVAVTPATVRPVSVEISVDGKSVGRCATRPYSVEFDTETVPDGEHLVKASAKDSSGNETWSATTKVEVVNSSRKMTSGAPTEARPAVRPPTSPPTPTIATKKTRPDAPITRDKISKAAKGGKSDKISKRTKPDAAAAKGKGLPAGMTLDRTYSNDNYGFSIQYPGSWVFRDQTVAMENRSDGDCRLAFGAYPVEKASLVVNVRRCKLQPGTDANKFATYNSYVKKWESRTVLDSPAFATTSRVLRPKPAVVHRLIIVKDGCAWMLNCTDTTGKPPNESLGLFEAIVATFQPSSEP